MPTETGRSRSRVRVFSRHAESVPVLPAAVIDRQLLAQIRAFTTRAKDEWGGLVVGYAESGRLVYVLAAFPPQLMQSPTRCTFANRYRVALKLGLWTAGLTDVLPRVDWLHTHPDLGVFLSPIDNNTFDAFRIEDPQILALVYDPIRDALGWFAGPRASARPVIQTSVALTPLRAEGVIATEAILRLLGVSPIFQAGSDETRALHSVRAKTHVALANILQDRLHHTLTATQQEEHDACLMSPYPPDCSPPPGRK